jgi:hypothetical protein
LEITSVKSSQYSLTRFPDTIHDHAYSSKTLTASSSVTLPALRNANNVSENTGMVYGKDENEVPKVNNVEDVGVEGKRFSLEPLRPRIIVK